MNDLIFVGLSSFGQYDQTPVHSLQQSGVPYRVHATGKRITRPELHQHASDATVIIAGVESYDVETLAGLPALRCISRCGAGTDNVDLAAAAVRGIAVLNTPDVPTNAVAELAVTMMLALARNLVPQARHMRNRQWLRVDARLLAGSTVGLIGFGRIGRRVAELLGPFGARMIACDPFATAASASTRRVDLTSLEELLQSSDVVSLHAARSPQRPLSIGPREIALMKPGALLVNVARGGMVDEQSLHDALASRRLGGAALDVFCEEPYAGPLCELDSVILTPHSATLTLQTRVAMESECVDKALRFLRGELQPGERVA